ncbi:nucleotidyltransferase family protein [Nakamurella sp. GG22]
MAARCLALDAFAAATSDLLAAGSVPCLLLKGPATAHRLYPERPDQRSYTDVDLLVPADRFGEAEDLLRRNGYRSMLEGVRPGEFPWHETVWQGPIDPSLHLDLHRGFAGVADPDEFFEALWSRREVLDVSSRPVPIPSVSGTAVILALHAASPGRDRKPLRDIARATEVFDRAAWREAAAIARRGDAEPAFRAGLGLLPDGLRLADELEVTGQVAADQWLGGRQFDRVSVNLAKALAERGVRGTVRYGIRKLFPSPAFVRLWDVEARRGPVALVSAYRRRVRRAVVGGPRAIADVLEARRSTRSGVRRTRRSVRAVLAAGVRADRTTVLSACWALRMHRTARRQLRSGGVRDVGLTSPPGVRPRDRAVIAAVLRWAAATCLESAVVLQRFDAAAGRSRDVIIAVTAPGYGFRAHAWLDGDPQPDLALHEIVRYPA